MTLNQTLDGPPRILLEPFVRAALLEDLGRGGDLTSRLTAPAEGRAEAVFAARAPGAVAGLACAALAMEFIDPEISFERCVSDGALVARGDKLAVATGPARSILTAERTALNFLGHLSGIATATANFARAIAHTKARICCTRKTTPGLRMLEKYAVRAGGGSNHRFGLDDAVLIKDNHIAAAGGVAAALNAARDGAGHLVKIEIEVDRLDQLEEALAIGVDAVLLDNMDLATLKEAVATTGGRTILEASGNVTLETVGAIAETGVDYISSGWLTHSAPTLDIGLDFRS